MVTKFVSGDCTSPRRTVAVWDFAYNADSTRVPSAYTAYDQMATSAHGVATLYFKGCLCEVNDGGAKK